MRVLHLQRIVLAVARGAIFLLLLVFVLSGCGVSQREAGTPEPDVVASDPPIELGEEYEEYERKQRASRANTRGGSFLRFTLLYLPNRILDLLDIFRADLGIGPATGAVVRLTRWGQIGIRSFSPGSLRLGLAGRRLPIFIERTSEFGVGPGFLNSTERPVTALELGGSVDLLLVGLSLGLSVDELADFVLGVLGIDFKDDDLQ